MVISTEHDALRSLLTMVSTGAMLAACSNSDDTSNQTTDPGAASTATVTGTISEAALVPAKLVAAFDVHAAADGSPSTLWIGISGDATNACDPVCAGDQNAVEISIPATTPTSGTFSLTGDQADVASAYVNSTCPSGDGKDLSVFMGESGSVTLDVKSDTQIEGTFSIVFGNAFLGTGDGGMLSGTFVATPCPD